MKILIKIKKICSKKRTRNYILIGMVLWVFGFIVTWTLLEIIVTGTLFYYIIMTPMNFVIKFLLYDRVVFPKEDK